MTGLAEFILARIAEDEAVAKAADVKQCDPEWFCSPVRAARAGTVTVRSKRDKRPMARVESVTADEPDDITDGTAVAEHIARHDPARVLAECEAKRRIVELHWGRRTWVEAESPVPGAYVCDFCSADDAPPDWTLYPCDHLRLLALPYADHDSYQESWRP